MIKSRRDINVNKETIGRARGGLHTDRPVMLSEFTELFDELVPSIIIDNVININYSDLKILKVANNLIPGAVYKITDRFNYQSGGSGTVPNQTYEGNDRGYVFIKSLTTNSFSIDAVRIMAVPKSYSALIDGDTSIGVWNSLKSVNTGDLTIFSGNIFLNLNGNIGTTISFTQLDSSEWAYQDKSTSSYYEDKQFLVKYDFDTDWFTNQSDDKSNLIEGLAVSLSTINPCDMTNWNMPNMTNNRFIYSINCSVDSGTEENLIIYRNTGYTVGCIISNTNANGIINNTNCEISGVLKECNYNINCTIQSNSLISNIEHNVNCYIIGGEAGHGDIKNNNNYQNPDLQITGSIYLDEPSHTNIFSMLDNVLHNDLTLKGFILDISGDTTLDVEEMGTNNGSGLITEARIVYLTASQATRSITSILNWITPINYIKNKKIRFYVEAGLIVTFVHGTGANQPRCEGGASAVLDGDTGDWIEFELYNGVIKQSNIGTY